METKEYSRAVASAFNGRGVDPSTLTPRQRLDEIATWYLGYRGWGDTFLHWAQESGFKISPAPDKD